MKRSLIFLLMAGFVLAIAHVAFAWQPRTVADGTSSQKILFNKLTSIQAGADGVSDVQVINDGTGTLTVSFSRYTGPGAWPVVWPWKASKVADHYYTVADSVYTLDAGETLWLKDLPEQQQPHGCTIRRPVSTSFKVLWK